MPVPPAALLIKAIAPSAAGTALTFGFNALGKGMRARTEAAAFSAEVDVFCARMDQFLHLLKAHEMRHVEARAILEVLCRHAEALMDRMEDTKNEPKRKENQEKLSNLLNHMKTIHEVFQDSADKIRRNVKKIDSPGKFSGGNP